MGIDLLCGHKYNGTSYWRVKQEIGVGFGQFNSHLGCQIEANTSRFEFHSFAAAVNQRCHGNAHYSETGILAVSVPVVSSLTAMPYKVTARLPSHY